MPKRCVTITALRCVTSQKRADLLSISLCLPTTIRVTSFLVFLHATTSMLTSYRTRPPVSKSLHTDKTGWYRNLLHFFNKFKAVSHSTLPDFRKSILKVHRLRPLVLAVRPTFRWRRVWGIGGMIQGGEKRTRIKTYLNAALFTSHFAWTDLGSNRGLRGERQSPNRLNHGTATCFSFQEVK